MKQKDKDKLCHECKGLGMLFCSTCPPECQERIISDKCIIYDKVGNLRCEKEG